MSESENPTLACLECGRPIAGARRWLCSAKCTAVLKLVWYGRRRKSDDLWPIRYDRLGRYRREAKIEVLFPTQRVQGAVLDRDKHRCLLCGASGADEVDYQSDEPSLEPKVRGSKDFRTLCSGCHLGESRRRFVDDRGRVAHTAAATWARIEAAEPLVPRDAEELWSSDEPWGLKRQGFLRKWPLASEEPRLDLERLVEVLGERATEAQGNHGGEQPDPMDALNAALDRLDLPLRREEHLVRAIHALLFAAQIDPHSGVHR
jgi:5-methylcytosine-specific restriction endonuclease McrA